MVIDQGSGIVGRGMKGEGGVCNSRAQRPVSAGRRAQATARPERRAPPTAPAPRRLRTPPRQTPATPPTLSDGTLPEHLLSPQTYCFRCHHIFALGSTINWIDLCYQQCNHL